MTDATWLEEDTQGESLEENAARGGFLSKRGRRAAIRDALPLVGRYFQRRGSAAHMRSSAAVGRGPEQATTDERLLSGLRLRAALATSERLLSSLEEVSRRPTFRYALTQAESVGELRGTLDIGRYVARPPVSGEPPTYPILDVHRSSETPENVMCAYVAVWMTDELRHALDGSEAGANAPETTAAGELIERLETFAATPALRGSLAPAREALVRGTEEQLLDRVDERLRRGEVANPQPYVELLSELRDLRVHGPTGSSGDAIWSFYDDSFDARLFELWCLYRIGLAVSEALSVDMTPVHSDWASGGLTYRWTRPVGVLELHYQRSLTTVTPQHLPRWIRPEDEKTLGGIPDIIARAVTHTGTERVALLDAKLRQRSGPPTEEMYKILGYFNNFSLDKTPRGAILYHAPQTDEPLVYEYEDAATSGLLLATALNPSVERQVVGGLGPVADMIIGLLGLPSGKGSDDRAGTRGVEEVIRQRLAELDAIAVTLAPQTLDASKRRLKAAVGDVCWSNLNTDAQRMVATAEHVGFFLDGDADFSGPVLGLVSPLEALLQKRLIEPAKAAHPEVRGFQQTLTFGTTLDMIKHVVQGSKGAASEALREVLDGYDVSYARFEVVLDVMVTLNVDYRRPAAHKAALSEQQWLEVYSTVVVGKALLSEVVDLLHDTAAPDGGVTP